MADEKTKKKTKRHASALKAHRKSLVRKDVNFQVRNAVRTMTKKVLTAIKDKNIDAAKAGFLAAQAAWEKASNKGVFHKNAAARQISNMARRLAGLSKSPN